MARFTLPRDLYNGKGALEALKDAGVTVSELTPEDFKAAGQAFYEDPQIKAMWSEGLIEEMNTITAIRALKKLWAQEP